MFDLRTLFRRPPSPEPAAPPAPVVGPSKVMGMVAPVVKGSGSVGMHIHVDIGDYVLEGYIYNTDQMIIAFEHAQVPRGTNDLFREGWGARLFRKEQRSHL